MGSNVPPKRAMRILAMLRHLPAVEVEAVGETGAQRDQVVAGLGVWIGYALDGRSGKGITAVSGNRGDNGTRIGIHARAVVAEEADVEFHHAPVKASGNLAVCADAELVDKVVGVVGCEGDPGVADAEPALDEGCGLPEGPLGGNAKAEDAVLAVNLRPVNVVAVDVSAGVYAEDDGAGVELAELGQMSDVIVNAIGGPKQPWLVGVAATLGWIGEKPRPSELLGIEGGIDSGLGISSGGSEGDDENSSYGSQFHRCFLLRRVWGTDEHIEPEGQCQQQISIAERFPRRKMGGEPVVARPPAAPCRTFSVLPGQDSSRPEKVPFRGRGPDAWPGLR